MKDKIIEMLCDDKILDEKWKHVKGYEGLYLVSDRGRVMSLPRKRTNGGITKPKILKMIKHGRNKRNTPKYNAVALYKNGARKKFLVHRLVAEAFIKNDLNKPFINHKDGNPSNNNVNNLEWCTPKENVHHAWKNGLCKNSVKKGKDNNMSVAIAVYNSNNELILEADAINEACIKLNLNSGNVQHVLNGRRKHTKGYHFKRICKE